MKKSWLFPFIIAILTLFVWHKLLFQTFLGEAYVYFEKGSQFLVFGPEGSLENLSRFDNLARFLYLFVEKIFVGNLKPFLIFLWLSLALMNLIFYFLVLKMTGKKLVAFLASFFWGTNFLTHFEIVATGFYQWPAQRFFNLLFCLLAFLFYLDFLKKRRKRLYLFSLLLFFLAVFSAHASLFFLPIFIFYSLLKERLAKAAALFLPFVFGSWLIIQQNRFLSGQESFLDFFFQIKDLINGVIFQLTTVGLPFNFWPYLQKLTASPIKVVLSLFYTPVVLFYLFSLFYFFKNKKKEAPILLVCFLSFFSVAVLNLYINSDAILYQVIGSNRYFFPLSFWISLYWAILIHYLLEKKNWLLSLGLLLFVSSWFFQNTKTIWKKMDEDQYKHELVIKTQRFIRENSFQLQSDILVVVPREIGPHGVSFLKKFYGQKGASFVLINQLGDSQKENFRSQKDWLLIYNEEAKRIGNQTNNYLEFLK